MGVKNLQRGLDSMSNNLRGIGGSRAGIIAPQSFYVIELKCKDCGHKQQTICPGSPFSLEYFAFKFWCENFKKCPKCGKKNWEVKIIGKNYPWILPIG